MVNGDVADALVVQVPPLARLVDSSKTPPDHVNTILGPTRFKESVGVTPNTAVVSPPNVAPQPVVPAKYALINS